MTRITTHAQLEPLLATWPCEDEGTTGVGQRVDDEADYAWLDEEMMKVGSLRHADVDWEGAETRAVCLLSEHGKDLKVLGHLLHCLQQDADVLRFALSLTLLAGVLNSWWQEAWPFQGLRGERARSRQFIQLTQRSAKLTGSLDFLGAENERELCRKACDSLIHAARTRELPVDALEELKRTLSNAPMAAVGVSASSTSSPSSSTQPGGERDSPSEDNTAPKMPEIRLESGNERSNRQALLKMADFLNEQSPGDPLGYRLRRHAIWHAIHALPGTRDGIRTELAPVSADRIADYREALTRHPDTLLWQRIEASLAVSPYWLEGHRLSAEVAAALGHSRCAAAIREESARFVDQLPGIDALTFNDGSAFVDDVTRHWLDSTPTGSDTASPSGGEPWQAGLEQARGCLAEEGLQAALGVLDQGLAQARSPRDHAYWRLASAELLDEAGLSALAQQHYQALQQALADIDLARWEPTLLARLEKSLKNSK
nr:type VI secretion system protein TssA [uncultured Halomonas sp.]